MRLVSYLRLRSLVFHSFPTSKLCTCLDSATFTHRVKWVNKRRKQRILHFASEVAMLMDVFHTGTLDPPAVSAGSPNGVDVESELDAALALGTSNSNDEPECFRPRKAVVHKDIAPAPCVKTQIMNNISPRQRAFCNPMTMSAHSGTTVEVSIANGPTTNGPHGRLGA